MSAAFEEMLAFVLAQFDAPVERDEADGAVLVTSGEPGEVIVRLTTLDITVAEYSLEWRGEHAASVEPIVIGSVIWSAISADAAMRVVKGLIGAAREARLSTFRVCVICERNTPPEWMASDDVCQECAEEEHEVVH